DDLVTGVQTCALPISPKAPHHEGRRSERWELEAGADGARPTGRSGDPGHGGGDARLRRADPQGSLSEPRGRPRLGLVRRGDVDRSEERRAGKGWGSAE